MKKNLSEVLEHGPIVFTDGDTGVVITINGSYLNWWIPGRDGYVNTDCRSTGVPDGLDRITVSEAMERAEAWFNEAMEESDD